MADGQAPLITVVIPCFNQARFLAHSVGSVYRQRYPRLQLIVVDDGSSDATMTTASGLGAEVTRQQNRGVGAARNAGLAAARGDLVVFLDADDELLDGALELGVEALRQHPGAACAVGHCISIDAAGEQAPQNDTAVDASDLYRTWLSRNFVWAPGAAMFRRRDLLAIGGFPTLNAAAADYAVYLAFARHDAVVYHGSPVAAYRQHDGSMSRNPALMLRATLTVLRSERRLAPARYAGDFARGRRAWAAWYGEQIVESLRRDWHRHRRGWLQLAAAATLLRYCPRVATRHLLKKASLTAGRRRRDMPLASTPPRRD